MSQQDTTAASARPTITRDDVQHVAELANLELTEQELDRFGGDLQNILRYIDQLDELNTADVPAMAQVSDVLQGEAAQAVAPRGETLRADVVKPSVSRELVMAEAPETDGRFFKVPKVIER